MKSNKIIKYILVLLIVFFLFLIFITNSGYYEYELSKNKELTNEAIEKFEEDIKSGKEIDINNYVDTTEKDYSNKVSNLGNDISNTLENVFSKGFSYLFKYISNQADK